MKRQCGGFTLVEMLVIVAAVVVLISIILPLIYMALDALDAARKIACASNQRQWGQAVHLYAADHRRGFVYNRQATAGVPIGGHNVSWNSSAVQDFWREYLRAKVDSGHAADRPTVLDCPTRQWHYLDDIDAALAQLLGPGNMGLSGYFFLPYRNPGNIDYTPAGNQWVTRTRLGSRQAGHLPVLMDVKQTTANGAWLAGQVVLSSHADDHGEPVGGNFLYEDASVRWHRGETVVLSARMHGWGFWYNPGL